MNVYDENTNVYDENRAFLTFTASTTYSLWNNASMVDMGVRRGQNGHSPQWKWD